MNTKSNIVITDDGSSTLFSEDTGDFYHSLHGAETESNYVFIEKGLKHCRNIFPEINILEVGLGTGLNLCLTYHQFNLLEFENLNYVALEPHPVDAEVVDILEYNILKNSEMRNFYNKLHRAEWNEKIEIQPFFTMEKLKKRLQDYEAKELFNLIYFDAFGPAYQPEMWEFALISKVCSMMSKGGVLVSYCAQGQFRRNLEACALKVERLPGPPGKREMIRAIK